MSKIETYNKLTECEDKVTFKYGKDSHFEGWVDELTEDAVLVMWTPSPIYAQMTEGEDWAPQDEWIKLEDIIPASIECYSVTGSDVTGSNECLSTKKWWQFWR